MDTSTVKMIEDSAFLLKKNRIIQEIIKEMYAIAKKTQQEFENKFELHPKVSRGENLQGLPYLVLDYPRLFNQEDIFAFRTLFWWGNYISFTLHLKGKYLNEEIIQQIIESEYLKDAYISFKKEEWNHDIGSSSYLKIENLKNDIEITSIPFIKVTIKSKLSSINNLESEYSKAKKLLLRPFYGYKF